MLTIKRMSDKIEVTIHTARPGLVIGKKGAEIDVLKKELKELPEKTFGLKSKKLKDPILMLS